MKLPFPFQAKAVKIGNSISITISKQIADYLKTKEDDSVEITVENSEIVVQKEKKG